MYSKIPSSIDRWCLTGYIETKAPLHVGDGLRLKIKERDLVGDHPKPDPEDPEDNPEYASIFVNHKRKPTIPGTSLKGGLRAWALQNLPDREKQISQIFGKPDTNSDSDPDKKKDGHGGPVVFHDAVLEHLDPPADFRDARHWSPARQTMLVPQVVLDSRTRSAEEGLLYWVEYVPANAKFCVELSAQNLPEELRRLLLFILREALSDRPDAASFGSDHANGWGKASWRASDVHVMGHREIRAWLCKPTSDPWHKSMRCLEVQEKTNWLNDGGAAAVRGFRESGCITLSFRLAFDGPMLINDPTRFREKTETRKGVGHTPVTRSDGRPYLPAQSVRGAFRAAARRVWQTLAWGTNADLNKAIHADEASRSGLEQKLTPFLKMFGATGWRSPMEWQDFELEGAVREHAQHFVAIDRFTGSVAGSKKFEACALDRPVFTGTLVLRPDRWKGIGAGDWTWLLLAYTLRDWVEGDGQIGFGASKGYGSFRATVDFAGQHPAVSLLSGILKRDPTVLADDEIQRWSAALQQELSNTEAVA